MNLSKQCMQTSPFLFSLPKSSQMLFIQYWLSKTVLYYPDNREKGLDLFSLFTENVKKMRRFVDLNSEFEYLYSILEKDLVPFSFYKAIRRNIEHGLLVAWNPMLNYKKNPELCPEPRLFRRATGMWIEHIYISPRSGFYETVPEFMNPARGEIFLMQTKEIGLPVFFKSFYTNKSSKFSKFELQESEIPRTEKIERKNDRFPY